MLRFAGGLLSICKRNLEDLESGQSLLDRLLVHHNSCRRPHEDAGQPGRRSLLPLSSRCKHVPVGEGHKKTESRERKFAVLQDPSYVRIAKLSVSGASGIAAKTFQSFAISWPSVVEGECMFDDARN